MSPRTKGLPFRGVGSTKLEGEPLLEEFERLRQKVRDQLALVRSKRRTLGDDELAGEPAAEELRAAERELERLQAIETSLSGRAQQAKKDRERRLEITRARELQAALPDLFQRWRDTVRTASAAERELQDALSGLERAFRKPDVYPELTPLSEAVLAEMELLPRVGQGRILGSVDLELWRARAGKIEKTPTVDGGIGEVKYEGVRRKPLVVT